MKGNQEWKTSLLLRTNTLPIMAELFVQAQMLMYFL
jgi:hypothetical protein